MSKTNLENPTKEGKRRKKIKNNTYGYKRIKQKRSKKERKKDLTIERTKNG